MQAGTWLQRNTRRLRDAGISSARLDCLILLEDGTGHDRAWLLAHPEHEIPTGTVGVLDNKVARRETHEPLAYIRGQTEFYGRTFYVDRHVLEPRPESETMISLLKDLPLPASPAIVDIGTGSGALAITAKLELPQADVAATDIDPQCLAVARRNAKTLGAEITCHEADLLLDQGRLLQADVILANLPYMPDNFQINPAAMNEPRLAIFGGRDGLDPYRRLFAQINDLPAKPAYLLTEALPPQHGQLAGIAKENGYDLRTAADFIQLFVPTR